MLLGSIHSHQTLSVSFSWTQTLSVWAHKEQSTLFYWCGHLFYGCTALIKAHRDLRTPQLWHPPHFQPRGFLGLVFLIRLQPPGSCSVFCLWINGLCLHHKWKINMSLLNIFVSRWCSESQPATNTSYQPPWSNHEFNVAKAEENVALSLKWKPNRMSHTVKLNLTPKIDVINSEVFSQCSNIHGIVESHSFMP